MNFRLELAVKPFQGQINIRHKVALVGSCFTDHMGSRLRALKFDVLENPNGIVFNPLSIERAISACLSCRKYDAKDLFYHNELWTCWDFHGQYSHPDQSSCLHQINSSVINANAFLQSADWLIVTLGSAFVYELANDTLGGTTGEVVANCHKVPASHFHHRLAGLDEVMASCGRWIEALRRTNSTVNIIFTVSPVRHHREGLVENNRSKGTLHLAVQQLLTRYENLYYFPAYELVIDDLRDYRFYAEDLVHPNYAATQYVWEKFTAACMDESTRSLMHQLEGIRIAMQHRPHHAGSAMHQQFLAGMFKKVEQLHEKHPWLPLEEELRYFSQC